MSCHPTIAPSRSVGIARFVQPKRCVAWEIPQRPLGRSGGGVWSFGASIISATTAPALVGIAIEWREKTRHKVIVSTRIEQILLAIGHKHADVQRAIGTKLIELRRTASSAQSCTPNLDREPQ
jgi:hypothetical protein